MPMTPPRASIAIALVLTLTPAALAQVEDITPRSSSAWYDNAVLDPDVPPLNKWGGIPSEVIENPEYELDLSPDNPEATASLKDRRAVLDDTLELWRTARPEQQDEIRQARLEQWQALSTFEKTLVRTQWNVRWQQMPDYRRTEVLHALYKPRLDRDVARAQGSVDEYHERRANPPKPKLYGPDDQPRLYKPRLIWNPTAKRRGLDGN